MDLLLQTARLYFRELTLDDTDTLYGLLSDPAAMEWYPQTYSRDESRAWIERAQESYARHGHGFWATLLKDGGDFIGICGVLQSEVEGTDYKALAYILRPKFWGQGYATEAAQALLAYGFETLKVKRVIAMIRPENDPSIRVAKRLGMSLEKEVFWKGFMHGVWVKIGNVK